jgi:DNA end-binding protein Ku
VAEAEIDPVFYEKSYYLAPDERAEKPYALLFQALQEKKLAAVAAITIRKKEQLCVLRPQAGVMMMETLYYPDEIRAQPEADVKLAKVSDRELQMAFTLIDLLRKPFDPTEYKDHYREALEQLIEAKLEGKEVVTSPAAAETKVIDLADALRKSVEAARKSAKPAKAASRRRPEPARRRTRKVS